MRVTEYEKVFEQAFKLGRRLLVVGPPGVGKTLAKMNVCRRNAWHYIGLCSALEDPSSIRGYPSRGADGEATHCLFDGIARAMKATEPTCLDFDDLGMAAESTMRAIIRLFQFGEIDNRKLPDCVVLSASTNDIGHGAGVYGMIEPLKTRFHSIINIGVDLDDVIGYGLSRNWPSDMLAFLRNTPAAVHDYKPTKDMKVGGSCPRGWEYAAEWINNGITDPEVISGCIGQGRATEYLAFRDMISELPDIADVLLNPDTAPVPENPSAQYLVSMALSAKMDGSTFGQAIRYLTRMPQMFRALSVRDGFRGETAKRTEKMLPKDHRSISSSRDFTAWVVSEDGKEIMSGAGKV